MLRMVVSEANELDVVLSCGHRVASDSPIDDAVECSACDRREIPPTTTPGRRTPRFDAQSVPPALLEAHVTRAWAQLVVVEGFVRFHEASPMLELRATPANAVVIVPDRPHRIEPSENAEFYVQFHEL